MKWGDKMKIDMHCHVHEGSLDSKVKMEEYIETLKEKGFQGMVVTDHNTYNGYRYWKHFMKGKEHTDFVVLKGVEYDTRDAGHILVIMPEGVKMRLMEIRGLQAATLIDFVHRNGGICGPAHPCGEKYLSFTNTKRYFENPELIKRFDFIEAFNACESADSNAAARKLCEKYRKPGIGGSDAHKPECIGLGYTILPEDVTCETELIQLIRKGAKIEVGGQLYGKTTKEKLGKASSLWVYSFWFYNLGGRILRGQSRKKKNQEENPIDPIDPIEAPFLTKIKRKKV